MYAIQNSHGEYFAGWGANGSEPEFTAEASKAWVYGSADGARTAAALAQLCQERIERVWID
jgi:hypothetical protein